MNSNEALPVSIPFCVLSGVVVMAVVMFWTPFRSGRRPLALFDQLTAIGMVAVLNGSAVGVEGLALWGPGLFALAAGLASYLLVNGITRRVGPPNSEAGAVGYIGLVFIVSVATTWFGFRLGSSLFQPWTLP